MKINTVKCYQFSNYFLVSLHAHKSIEPVRFRYPVGKSAQGSNQKVIVARTDHFARYIVVPREIYAHFALKSSFSPLKEHLRIEVVSVAH